MTEKMTDRERFPRYFVEKNIDRRQCERTVPMKVLVIGMLRTGTLSGSFVVLSDGRWNLIDR